MAMGSGLSMGVDQSPREEGGVLSSLVHSDRCLGRLSRWDARTLGNAANALLRGGMPDMRPGWRGRGHLGADPVVDETFGNGKRRL